MRLFIGDAEWENMEFQQLGDATEIIFTGPQAVERMEDVGSRGVAEEKLSWQDGDKIRDFRWREYCWADDLPATPADKYLRCGISALSKRVNWRLPELVLVAGPFGSGKSLFCQILAQDFVCCNDQWASLTCWEDEVEEIRDGLKLYRDSTIVPAHMKGDFLSRFRLTLNDPTAEREISEHFSRIEYEAKRFGIKFFVLDPWNEFTHRKHKAQTEAEYVIAVLTEGAILCNRLKIIILLTTHVSSEFISLGDDFKPFRISNAFGTSQFGNKVHRGFCVTRTRMWNPASHMIVRQDKVKLENKIKISDDGTPIMLKERMGYPDTLAFLFKPELNTIHHDGPYSDKARERWR